MRHALSLARRGLGQVWPNPAVGCILVKDGRIVGRGSTGSGGRPHGESLALHQAGSLAEGSTAYVSLEPCAHHGQTPPCANALVNAGIRRAVIAIEDPDPRVSGRGTKILASAGVEVETGICADEARSVNAGFILKTCHQRPFVSLKFATSLDGRIATSRGDSRWITGDRARRYGHWLRASHDAILIGINTATQDNPSLTCRLEGLEDRSPVRVVLDSKGRLTGKSALLQSASEVLTWIVTEASNPDFGAADAIRVKSCRDLELVLSELAKRGITRLLVEGGGQVQASFIRSGLVDRIEWFRSASVIGGDGLPAVGDLGLGSLNEMPRFRRTDIREFGDDILESYERTA